MKPFDIYRRIKNPMFIKFLWSVIVTQHPPRAIVVQRLACLEARIIQLVFSGFT